MTQRLAPYLDRYYQILARAPCTDWLTKRNGPPVFKVPREGSDANDDLSSSGNELEYDAAESSCEWRSATLQTPQESLNVPSGPDSNYSSAYPPWLCE